MFFKDFTCHLRGVEMDCNRPLHFRLLTFTKEICACFWTWSLWYKVRVSWMFLVALLFVSGDLFITLAILFDISYRLFWFDFNGICVVVSLKQIELVSGILDMLNIILFAWNLATWNTFLRKIVHLTSLSIDF